MAPAEGADDSPMGAAGGAAEQSPSGGAAAGVPRRRPGHSPGARRGGTAAGDGADNPFEKVENLMKGRDFRTAEVTLRKMLKATPEDDRVLHYLGVLLTEESRYEEAETVFQGAFDAQEKAGKVNYATAFGLATVLTEIGGMEKLLQGEALFRDVLARAVEQEEGGIHETYSAFVNLADNFGRQKRWIESAEAWTSAVKLAERMFGEDHERTAAHRAALARAERLSRYQWWIRRVLWTVSIVVFVWAAWTLVRSGMLRAVVGHAAALVAPGLAGGTPTAGSVDGVLSGVSAPVSGEL